MSQGGGLEDALAYARAIADIVRQPLAVLDRELRLRHANPAFRTLFDVPLQTRIDVVLELPQLADIFVHGTSPTHEVVRHDRQLVIDARRLGDAVVLTIEDVTQRRTQRFQERLIDAITDAVFSVDPNLRILTWNPAAEQFFGFSAAEAIGKSSLDVIRTETTYDRASVRARLAAGEAVQNELRIQRKDGEWVEVESSTVPVRDADGKPLGYVVSMHDIRETKQLERQLREHAKDVEEANRELDSFTYSVSHDLRAPLRAIDGFSRILVEDHAERMSKDEVRLLGVIRKNTQQMGQLIDDLLAFARLGRKELAVTTVDMKSLLIELVPEVLAGTEDRQIDLRAGHLPPFVGDRALLKQVWLNLLSNAIKYTRKRERAVITISGEVVGDELVYKVEDNGAGFDMQYIDKLFGVFQRLHRNTEFEGTGVGLALVQRIVRRHGGRVWAEGKEGVGATFWFALPRRGEDHG